MYPAEERAVDIAFLEKGIAMLSPQRSITAFMGHWGRVKSEHPQLQFHGSVSYCGADGTEYSEKFISDLSAHEGLLYNRPKDVADVAKELETIARTLSHVATGFHKPLIRTMTEAEYIAEQEAAIAGFEELQEQQEGTSVSSDAVDPTLRWFHFTPVAQIPTIKESGRIAPRATTGHAGNFTSHLESVNDLIYLCVWRPSLGEPLLDFLQRAEGHVATWFASSAIGGVQAVELEASEITRSLLRPDEDTFLKDASIFLRYPDGHPDHKVPGYVRAARELLPDEDLAQFKRISELEAEGKLRGKRAFRADCYRAAKKLASLIETDPSRFSNHLDEYLSKNWTIAYRGSLKVKEYEVSS